MTNAMKEERLSCVTFKSQSKDKAAGLEMHKASH